MSDSRPKPARTIRFLFWCVGSLLTLAVSYAGAEYAYRARISTAFDNLRLSVLASHASAQDRGIEFFRFGDDADTLEPSLFEDALAYLYRRLGAASRLDRWEPSDHQEHAYYLVAFNRGELGEADYCCHAFIWSPRLGKFVHYLNWDLSDIRPVIGCPWPSDPARDPCSRCGKESSWELKRCAR